MNTYIKLPNTIQSFHNTASRIETASSLRPVYVLEEEVQNSNVEYCFNCKCKMHIHSKQARSLKHLLFSNSADRLGRSTFGKFITKVFFFYFRKTFFNRKILFFLQNLEFQAQRHFPIQPE